MTSNQRLHLKKTTDWFAAGEGFLKAMLLLSDATFKLFVFVCLKADRHTATCRVDIDRLAYVLRKTRSLIETSLAELKAKAVCSIDCANGSEGRHLVQVNDEFWPYCKPTNDSAGQSASPYVAAVRQLFLELGCTNGRFGTAEELQAKNLEIRGVPLEVVRDAMIMGACRKYISWLNNGYSEPISSMVYFESVIAEFLHSPPPDDYREYLPLQLKRLAKEWSRNVQPQKQTMRDARKGGQQSSPMIRDDVAAVS